MLSPRDFATDCDINRGTFDTAIWNRITNPLCKKLNDIFQSKINNCTEHYKRDNISTEVSTQTSTLRKPTLSTNFNCTIPFIWNNPVNSKNKSG